MKFIHFAFIAFLVFSFEVYCQQVPNGSFETWTNPKKPDGWYTFSSASVVNLATRDTIEKVEGNASAKIQTATISGSTTYEILSLGTATFSFNNGYTYTPIQFSYRPDTLFFAYKYTSPGVDSATAYIKMSKGNKVLLESEFTLEKNAVLTSQFIHLTPLYQSSEIPDSLIIQFKSSKTRNNFFGIEGSTLNVDHVRFTYSNQQVNVSAEYEYIKPNIYPNPFNKELTFILPENSQNNILIYDILGKKILEHKCINSTTIYTDELKEGVYFFEIRNSNGIIDIGKIIKQ